MKRSASLLIAVLFVLTSCNKHSVTLKDGKDTAAYFIGISVAKNLKSSDFEKFDPKIIAKAIELVYSGDSVKYTDQEMQMKIQAYFMKLEKVSKEKNLKEGKDFLEKNKKNAGVVTLPSGLQYKIIRTGTGPKPDSSSIVNVNYVGKLINGDTFDKNPSAKFGATQVIRGWTEALLMMPVGSKWELYIPSELGFGERGAGGGKIKANMALIFEVELLSIEPKTDPKAVAPAVQAAPKMKMKK
jgi:FKBP-type peptidyl-prolyl cis-trans isomerase